MTEIVAAAEAHDAPPCSPLPVAGSLQRQGCDQLQQLALLCDAEELRLIAPALGPCRALCRGLSLGDTQWLGIFGAVAPRNLVACTAHHGGAIGSEERNVIFAKARALRTSSRR